MVGKHAEPEDGKPTVFISMQVLPANMQIITVLEPGVGWPTCSSLSDRIAGIAGVCTTHPCSVQAFPCIFMSFLVGSVP